MAQLLSTLVFADSTEQISATQTALIVGRAAAIPASATNVQHNDFHLVVPFDLTLRRLRVACLTKPSTDTTLTLRRSTDSGATWADVSGWTVTITSSGSAVAFSADPTDLDVVEGDVLGFRVSTGGGSGTNVILEIIGSVR